MDKSLSNAGTTISKNEPIQETVQSEEPLLEVNWETRLFELQFNIYYTKYDFVSLSIFTYITPKGEEDIGSLDLQADLGEFQFNQPVFIGKLTSGYLYKNAKQALHNSYKARSWMQRYDNECVSLQTFDNVSECIDCMLTKHSYLLCDFLYSAINTNQGSKTEKTQLFDTQKMRESCSINYETLQNSQKKQSEDVHTLKLQMIFCSREHLQLFGGQEQHKPSI